VRVSSDKTCKEAPQDANDSATKCHHKEGSKSCQEICIQNIGGSHLCVGLKHVIQHLQIYETHDKYKEQEASQPHLCSNTRRGYEVLGMILLQAYVYTCSLERSCPERNSNTQSKCSRPYIPYSSWSLCGALYFLSHSYN